MFARLISHSRYLANIPRELKNVSLITNQNALSGIVGQHKILFLVRNVFLKTDITSLILLLQQKSEIILKYLSRPSSMVHCSTP